MINGDDKFPMDEIKTESLNISTEGALDCMIQGCKKKSISGNIQIHLCEDHLHLAFKPRTYKRPFPKIGRNDECLCGSKKKFKKCCGQ